ncbi:nucleoside-diphosphate sugar epimerase [Carnobacterium divergens]|uniref:NAD-dependent epimerase/dehydratase family protein n=1 Tax=Carnobacterium divergens TaxID=2748 RepID=UPI000E76BC19|nr:NAD(P)-dependent oxidoreductase [Carnobacterium divergens]ANZ99494.1 nucleoside-diphosphate sugar epimerase [Carnobacterium divergens]
MYIVIGASSFIGVYTVNELINNGLKVLATGRNEKFKDYYESLGVDYITLDITKKETFDLLPTEDVDGVILLAGLLPANANVNLDEEENASDYIVTNTLGTLNVLEYCQKNKINKIISTTSYADVFSSWKKNKAINDEQPRGYSLVGDHAAYVISKNAASDLLEYYNHQHGMENMIFRLPPVYGVGPHGSLFINGRWTKSGLQIFIENAIEGKEIKIFGDRELSRDVIYVKDVARAFRLGLESNKAKGLYNMTSGNAVTLKEQVEVIIDVFSEENNKSTVIYDESTKNNTPSYLFNMEKAKEDFNFVPEYADYKRMMLDYKKELETGVYTEIFN